MVWFGRRQQVKGLPQNSRSYQRSLWSRRYYIGSSGHVSDATVRRYIAHQKGRS